MRHKPQPDESPRFSSYLSRCLVCGNWLSWVYPSFNGKKPGHWRHASRVNQ